MLCEALKQSTGLRSLNLSINNIGDTGASRLASWIVGECHLRPDVYILLLHCSILNEQAQDQRQVCSKLGHANAACLAECWQPAPGLQDVCCLARLATVVKLAEQV